MMRIRVKLAVIAALMVVLAVPLLLVVSKTYERKATRDQGRIDIAQSWTGDQAVIGPVLIVPYTRTITHEEYDRTQSRIVTTQRTAREQLYLVPDLLTANVNLASEIRYRGIYEVPVYTAAIGLTGEFDLTPIGDLLTEDDGIEVGDAFFSIGVSDMRGIAMPPQIQWNASTQLAEPGSHIFGSDSGVHVKLADISSLQGSGDDAAVRIPVEVSLALRGMSAFNFVPVGRSTSLRVQSNWPHPKFTGRYLPTDREISDEGFVANWQTSTFSTNIVEQARRCAVGDCNAFLTNQLGVSLIDPVDIYLQAQRATKYGILFIGLTFTAFFLFEVLKALAIHPIQYGLVGLALAVFYLLLVSLAEHISFGSAYLVATVACCSLLGFYITYVLKSVSRGLGFAAGIASLYGLLWFIIEAEDYAFSMGALLIFVLLASVMFLTRKVDWFEAGKGLMQSTHRTGAG